MIQLPVKLADIKDLRELGFVFIVPLFTVAYCCQFGFLAHPDALSTLSRLGVAAVFFSDGVSGIVGIVLAFGALIYVLGCLQMPLGAAAMIFLSMGFLGLVAIDQAPLLVHASQFWFWGCLAVGFAFLPSGSQGKK